MSSVWFLRNPTPKVRKECIAAVVLVFAASCHSSTSSGVPDAAASAGRPKIVHPRVTAAGEVPLDLTQSKLALTIIKDHVTPVTATLRMRDGSISVDGASPSARLSVDLDSFDSSIAIRNERVRNIFFETSAIGWESADLSFDLPKELVERFRNDKKLTHVKLEGGLKVHGHSSKLPVTFDAGYGDGGRIWVKSSAPVEVKVSDLELTDNLHRLNAICMHDSIDDIVKVDVSLVFAPSSH
jgi:hypothetical protein